MDIMGSHLEGFKQGSDLTDLGRRCLRLPWAGGTAEEQEGRQGPATAAIQVLSEVAWPGGGGSTWRWWEGNGLWTWNYSPCD